MYSNSKIMLFEKKSRIVILITLLSLIFSYGTISAQEKHDKSLKHEVESEAFHEEEKLNAGELIMDHVVDAYEWHIATVGDLHVSIPLPIILYSQESGFHTFMSSEFHHGHASYENFHIAGKGSKYKGKIVETINGEEVRPYDFSITKNAFALIISIILIMWLFLSVAKKYKQNPKGSPKGIQSFLEPLILFIRDDIAKASIGKKHYERFTPFLLSIFFFIFINNLLGLVPLFPGGANLTGNISVTLVLAVFTFIITTVSGNKHYWKHIFNTPGVPVWLKLPIPLMPIIELMSMLTKPFVLMVRLFANITAGHIVALGFFSLIFVFGEMLPLAGYGASVLSIIFTVFLTFLELLVAFIQAYVFTLLSALFFGMAVEEEH